MFTTEQAHSGNSAKHLGHGLCSADRNGGSLDDHFRTVAHLGNREIRARYARDVREMYARCTRDIREMYLRFKRDIRGIYARYRQDIAEVYARW